jgi:hypothetical protein
MKRGSSLYRSPNGRTILHRDGFSVIAAVSLPVWSAVRGLFRTALAAMLGPWIVHTILLVVLEPVVSPTLRIASSSAFVVAVVIASGCFANRWHRFVLEREGWVVIARHHGEHR